MSYFQACVQLDIGLPLLLQVPIVSLLIQWAWIALTISITRLLLFLELHRTSLQPSHSGTSWCSAPTDSGGNEHDRPSNNSGDMSQGCQSGTVNNSSFTAPWAPAAGRKRGRKGDGEEPTKKRRAKAKPPTSKDRRMACHFYKFDRHVYDRCRTCAFRGFADVKQHLVERTHKQPVHCMYKCILFFSFHSRFPPNL